MGAHGVDERIINVHYYYTIVTMKEIILLHRETKRDRDREIETDRQKQRDRD